MKRKLSADQVQQLLARASAGEKVSSLCRQFRISRALFYRIRARWEKLGRHGRLADWRGQVAGVSPRRVSAKNQKLILSIVGKHPEYSSKKIAKVLPKDRDGKSLVSNHGVQNVLARLDLSTFEKRREYSGGRRHIPTFGKLRAQDKLTIIRKVEKGVKVANVCRQYGISRTLFYRFFKRYKNALAAGGTSREQLLASISDQAPVPHHFWRLTPSDVEKKVLEVVAQYPQLSAHKLVLALPKAEGRPILSNKGVQNVLARNHLSTYEQRLAYSKMAEAAWKPRWRVADIPTIPLHIWRLLYAPFATIPKLGWLFTRGQLLLLFILFIGFYFYKIIESIITSPTGTFVGTFFASVSLTFGIFFFLYSLKYYLSILLVLRLAQSGLSQTGTEGAQETKESKGFFSVIDKFLHLRGENSSHLGGVSGQRVNPLLVNLDRVKLDSANKPFVSIHLAVYNERRVIERLIEACTSQEWYVSTNSSTPGESKPTPGVSLGGNPERSRTSIPLSTTLSVNRMGRRTNYEIIIVDDSTDETTEIAKESLTKGLGYSITRDTGSPPLDPVSEREMEIFRFSPPPDNPSLPTVKLIHRFTRAGFKGGALQEALVNTDPKAEYICVFDADFIPYPDTIEQFVKTFQVLTGSQVVGASGSQEPGNPNTRIPDNQRIAAVQGYQWHVLNKSQTWVTRGVRTEYAGSYVIERSGAELYGGLKQIAGAVYAIRADVLRQFGWGTSITEDFELTLRLYEAGYKVAFTPYIQTPAEAVSTIKKLIRQRMRWAEGASFNVKCMFSRMLFGRWEEQSVIARNEVTKQSNNEIATSRKSGTRNDREGRVWVPSRLTLAEKLEFAYLAPYYLQAAFFVIGTLSWFLAEAILGSRLPFWTAALGWSLVATNLLALPLMNIIGLFLEESDERDYLGAFSFIALSYIVVPFQAYAAVKGFLEREEGPWFRTPKTGAITDVLERSHFGKLFGNLFGKPAAVHANDMRMETSRMDANERTLSHSFRFAEIGINSRIPIKPRQIRWVGNLALGVIITVTVLMSIFAPLIPQASLDVAASERQFGTFSDSVKADDPVSLGESSREITEPVLVQFVAGGGKYLEYIFHPEPRVRTKFDGKEIELKVVRSDGLGKLLVKDSIKVAGNYLYEEIFDGVDLKYSVENGGGSLVENFILKKYKNFETIEYELKTVGLEVAYRNNEIYFAPRNGGNPLFTFTRPYLYEEKNPQNKNFGIEFVLEKDVFGWKLQKRLTQEGRSWLADPARQFPVVIDPTQVTSTIQTGIATDDSDYGKQQRKIVWANGATNGDAWYAVYEDAGHVSYEKCVPSVDGCEAADDWTDATDIDGGDNDNRQPSVWWENDQKRIWITWADNSADNAEFIYLDVDASDPGTASAVCSGPDQANHNPTTWLLTIAVADSAGSTDDIFITYVPVVNGVNNIYRIDVNSSIASTCTDGTEVTWNSIIANSGVSAGDQPIALAIGDDLHLIFQDGTTIRHSVSNNDGGTEWDRADTDITGADADNTSKNYSAVTDGTGIWFIIDQGTSGVDLWTCDPCSSSGTWTNAADPWSSQGTDITEVSLTYSSETDDIIAFALRGSGSTEEVIVESTDSTSISWGTEASLGVFGGGASGLEDLSATMSTNADDKSAFVVEDATNSELEFSTVPENILFLLVLGPFLPGLLKKVQQKRRA